MYRQASFVTFKCESYSRNYHFSTKAAVEQLHLFHQYEMVKFNGLRMKTKDSKQVTNLTYDDMTYNDTSDLQIMVLVSQLHWPSWIVALK